VFCANTYICTYVCARACARVYIDIMYTRARVCVCVCVCVDPRDESISNDLTLASSVVLAFLADRSTRVNTRGGFKLRYTSDHDNERVISENAYERKADCGSDRKSSKTSDSGRGFGISFSILKIHVRKRRIRDSDNQANVSFHPYADAR